MKAVDRYFRKLHERRLRVILSESLKYAFWHNQLSKMGILELPVVYGTLDFFSRHKEFNCGRRIMHSCLLAFS